MKLWDSLIFDKGRDGRWNFCSRSPVENIGKYLNEVKAQPLKTNLGKMYAYGYEAKGGSSRSAVLILICRTDKSHAAYQYVHLDKMQIMLSQLFAYLPK